MTHDELLAEIDKSIKAAEFEERWVWTTNAKALRAVVELHKPMKEKLAEPFIVDFCHKCKQIYPCETIQAIEKELS